MSESVSIVILDAEREAALDRTLGVIASTDQLSFEVVVHDAGSLASDGAERSDVKMVHADRSGAGDGRQPALQACAGDLVAFIPAGGYPTPTWLDSVAGAFVNEEVVVAGGPILDEYGVDVSIGCWAVDSLGRREVLDHGPPWELWSSPWSERLTAPDWANVAFRRSALLAIGGFDERYTGSLAMADACRRLLDRGWATDPAGLAAVHAGGRTSPRTTDTDDADDRRLFASLHGISRHSADEVGDVVGDSRHTALPKPAPRTTRLPDRAPPLVLFPVVHPNGRRLHVCYVTQEWLPIHNGVARIVHTRASGLAERGHVVRVLTLTDGPLRVDLEDGIWVHRVPSTPQPPPPMVMPPRLWERSASVLEELIRIDTTQAIDIVDVPNWDVEGYATILDGRFTTVLGLHSGVATYVATDSRFDPADPIVQEVLAAELACYRGATPSSPTRKRSSTTSSASFDIVFPGTGSRWSPTDCPRRRASTLERRRRRPALPRCCSSGGSEPRKGIDTLLAAIPIVLEQRPRRRTSPSSGDDDIEAPGGGTYRARFENSPEAARLPVDASDSPASSTTTSSSRHYLTCDVFVAPSRFESFGLVLLEAMRLGKPVVAGNAGGMREVVGDDGAGVLVPPGDAKRWRRQFWRSSPILRSERPWVGRARHDTRPSSPATVWSTASSLSSSASAAPSIATRGGTDDVRTILAPSLTARCRPPPAHCRANLHAPGAR